MEPIRLPDGEEVLVRPVQPEDKPLFLAAWERFGETSRLRRFMAAKARLTLQDLAYFTEVDHIDHEAIGALHATTREPLGVARYVRQRERPDCAEAAVAVVDAWQGRGLGGVLLGHLCRRAAANGIEHFTATLLVENRRMLRLFEHLGRVTVRRHEGATLEIEVELPVGGSAPATVLRDAASGQLTVESGE